MLARRSRPSASLWCATWSPGMDELHKLMIQENVPEQHCCPNIRGGSDANMLKLGKNRDFGAVSISIVNGKAAHRCGPTAARVSPCIKVIMSLPNLCSTCR